MTSVWYDDESNQIWIGDREEPFPPRTLAAYVDQSGQVHIHRHFQTKTIAGGDYSDIQDGQGNGFDSADAVMAYLSEVFQRKPGAGDRNAIGVAISERGQTVIPLSVPPDNYTSLRLVVNGVEYRPPDIAVSPVAVTWPADAFPLDPSDRVTVVYS